MALPSARKLYEAAEQAIFDLLVDGKAEASFQGRSYKAHDLTKLREVSDYYRKLAIVRGEIIADESEQAVAVSVAEVLES